MKKVLFSIMVIVGLATQVSCTNESEDVRFSNSETLVEEAGMSAEDVELIKLQNEIADLNARTFPEVPYTRGRGWWKWMRVFISDAVGGLFGNFFGGPIGAGVGAAACSAYAATNEVAISPELDNSYKISMNSSETALNNVVPEPIKMANGVERITRSDSIGYFHNKVLLEANKGDMLLQSRNARLLTEKICIAAKKTLFVDKEDVSIDEIMGNAQFSKFVEAKSTYLSANQSIDNYCEELGKLYPEQKLQINVIGSFIDGVSRISVDENDGSYAEKVLNLVDNANLSDDVKKQLRNGIIVGNASYQLWNLPN